MATFTDWIEHDGEGMPVDGDTFVLIRCDGDGYFEPEYRFVENEDYTALYWEGNHCDLWLSSTPDHITHYKIVTP